MSGKKILFVCPYPFNEAPSQRFRYEQYLPILENNGFHYKLAPFLSMAAWKIIYKKGHYFKKAIYLLSSYLRRFLLLFRLAGYEFVYIHREASPAGPPFFEWTAKYIFRKKIIYDFDDAIWLEDPVEKGSLKSWFKWKRKVKQICSWSYKVSCGNHYLAQYAKKFSSNVTVNPTTIDTDHLHIPSKSVTAGPKSTQLTLGWTGTHSTLHYLAALLSVLKKLESQYDFRLLVISNKKPDFELASLEYIPWSKETEIKDLNKIDIGLMPLTNDIWSRGKCGFKALQYMALAKPVIASAVGVNTRIVDDGLSGFLANTHQEWTSALTQLLNNAELRSAMGKKGLQKVQKYYSVNSNKNNFLSLFQHE